jgi:zinc transporter ZupT
LTAFVLSLLFGLGPFLGGIVLVTISGSIKLSQSFLMGTSTGISVVLSVWRPLQIWWGGKMSAPLILFLLFIGSSLFHAVETAVHKLMSRWRRVQEKDGVICATAPLRSVSLISAKAFLACGAVGLHAFAEGLALGVAAPKAYGLGRHMLLPVSLYGLLRGAAVAGFAYGAMGSWRSAVVSAAVMGFSGPVAAIAAIVSGITYDGLDYWMVIACGALFPSFFGGLFRRALRLHSTSAVYGLFVGLGFANICLASTKLVCLHTPYCNSAPEAVT